MSKMWRKEKIPETVQTTEKVQMLAKSMSEIPTYALLTTNQYIEQMKILIAILSELTKEVD
ncbi:hypothetical protein GF319_07210 [Candidatus Bathyarchaeota archaeon]|nr:hypothetical protein [Candidatus Bathyarchaeota archaeon]